MERGLSTPVRAARRQQPSSRAADQRDERAPPSGDATRHRRIAESLRSGKASTDKCAAFVTR